MTATSGNILHGKQVQGFFKAPQPKESAMNPKIRQLFLRMIVLLPATLVIFPQATAATLAGTGTVSGKVAAPKPFKAAQVYIRNTDKNILYMV